MNSDDLRTLQELLKQRFNDDPQSAVITLKAKGQIGEGVEPHSHRVIGSRLLYTR